MRLYTTTPCPTSASSFVSLYHYAYSLRHPPTLPLQLGGAMVATRNSIQANFSRPAKRRIKSGQKRKLNEKNERKKKKHSKENRRGARRNPLPLGTERPSRDEEMPPASGAPPKTTPAMEGQRSEPQIAEGIEVKGQSHTASRKPPSLVRGIGVESLNCGGSWRGGGRHWLPYSQNCSR